MDYPVAAILGEPGGVLFNKSCRERRSSGSHLGESGLSRPLFTLGKVARI